VYFRFDSLRFVFQKYLLSKTQATNNSFQKLEKMCDKNQQAFEEREKALRLECDQARESEMIIQLQEQQKKITDQLASIKQRLFEQQELVNFKQKADDQFASRKQRLTDQHEAVNEEHNTCKECRVTTVPLPPSPFSCPKCSICLDKQKVVGTRGYMFNPQDYTKVLTKDFIDSAAKGEEAYKAMICFHLDGIGFTELMSPINSENDHERFLAPRFGDILTGFELLGPKNLSHVDLYVGGQRLKRYQYEGKPITFYKKGRVGLTVYDKQNEGTLDKFCELDGIPLIALYWNDVVFAVNGEVSGIKAQYMHLDKALCAVLAQNPIYFSAGGSEKFKCEKGVMIQMSIP
jgi:hypothetical protein